MESFIFEDKNEYEYEIKLNVLARVLRNKKTPRKASFYFFFSKKVSRVIYTEGGKVLSR